MTNRELAREIVSDYFNNDKGDPFILTDGQCDIFNSIFLKEYRRTQVIACTQYGKSEVVAMALILRSQTFEEKWAIVTGSQPKSDIIMEKVIQHTFDDSRLTSELDIDSTELLNRLKRERSKKNLTWKCGGGIRTFTADARNRQKVKEALMGFGAENIVEDESALIQDDLQSTVLRMLGGHAGGYLVKIGNPLYRNHFKKTWDSPKYETLFIDYKQGLREGRYTEEFIEEMRGEAFFDNLYECKFPDEDEIDLDGYRRLISEEELNKALEKVDHKGDKSLGFDVGEGGDENVGVERSRAYAEIVHVSLTKDLMATAGVVIKLLEDHALKPLLVFLDATGIGAGVGSRIKELGKEINCVKWASKAIKEKTFANLKAENFWDARVWIKEGGKLNPDDDWSELLVIKYKVNSSGKIIIKSKEEMRKEGIKSPNIADALALSFGKGEEMPDVLEI